MTNRPDAALDSLSDQAVAYLDAAHRVAQAQFGPGTVRDVPLLVTQTATLMAALANNSISEDR